MNSSEISFAADRMLGRLARLLRLLGYDTLYAPNMTPARLLEIARASGRVILTRGNAEKRFPGGLSLLSVRSEYAPEQLREVVKKFGLDTRSGLWTRCTLCNGAIERVGKQEIEAEVKPRVFQVYDEFYRCAGCRHVYWRGSHVERILRNLEALIEKTGESKV
ncbi:MAG: Mut7-C RNAse domain-containing protein [Acidobacteriia bacterium]|nr:Mut7-C RNAse domain-containing protein [Terriglobia bacterium]